MGRIAHTRRMSIKKQSGKSDDLATFRLFKFLFLIEFLTGMDESPPLLCWRLLIITIHFLNLNFKVTHSFEDGSSKGVFDGINLRVSSFEVYYKTNSLNKFVSVIVQNLSFHHL